MKIKIIAKEKEPVTANWMDLRANIYTEDAWISGLLKTQIKGKKILS